MKIASIESFIWMKRSKPVVFLSFKTRKMNVNGLIEQTFKENAWWSYNNYSCIVRFFLIICVCVSDRAKSNVSTWFIFTLVILLCFLWESHLDFMRRIANMSPFNRVERTDVEEKFITCWDWRIKIWVGCECAIYWEELGKEVQEDSVLSDMQVLSFFKHNICFLSLLSPGV